MAKKIFILFILVITVCLNKQFLYSEDNSAFNQPSPSALNFTIRGDVLYRLDPESCIKLYDKVAAIYSDKGTLYYIRSSGDKWIAGFFKENSKVSMEFDLPEKYEKLYKFAGSNNIFYFLVQPVNDNGENTGKKPVKVPVFIRFNPDQMNFQKLDGVLDFILLDGKSVILKDKLLDYNGSLIPLLLHGKLKISEIIDSRIAIVSDGEETEIVDIIAEKSIYQYKNNSVPEYPGEYNLVLEFGDNITRSDIPSDMGKSLYYEILVDGAEENRTETGLGALSKIFHTKLAPGRYHIIKAERWELDKSMGRYVRMNNVYQPAELKIYIPENRILKIKIEFNGTSYKINQSVIFK